jgi:serine/threonine-protein kinase
VQSGDDSDPSDESGSYDEVLRGAARADPLPVERDLTGTTLAHYRLDALLGRGGMGAVYRATDERLRREVALKVLLESVAKSEERRRRFVREARAAAAVSHANIATVYDVGEADGRVFLAMELVGGTTLRARIDAGLDITDSLRIAKDIARGLRRAHEKGIVHRDLKPENVMITPDDEVKILDFGLAKMREPPFTTPDALMRADTEPALTGEGRVLGTPDYMSPEQARATEVDASTDVFAFGVVLFEMLTGTRPFARATTQDVLAAIERDAPPSISELNPRVPADVARVLERCLEKKREDRWASGRELVEALENAAASPREVPAAPSRSSGASASPPTSLGGSDQPARTPARTRLRVTPGAVVADRYRIERLLGEGGMGAVWAATHTKTRRVFALKVLKASMACKPRMRQRFLREARAACAVVHPSIVQVHDVFELPDANPVIVMELLEGETLGARLSRDATLPLAELARIMLSVCSAVGTAHHVGIVHRDLKPENIFLVADAGDSSAVHVKVLDFGVAKLTAVEGDAARSAGISGTETGMILGTPYYMSPEQMFAEKSVDHRADIWSLGVILYEALAGVRPTAADNVGQIFKIVATDAIVPLARRAPHLPESVTALVRKMLQHDRTKRLADLHEVCAVLQRHTDAAVQSFGEPTPPNDANDSSLLGGSDEATSTGADASDASARGGSRARTAAWSLLAFALAGGALYAWSPSAGPPDASDPRGAGRSAPSGTLEARPLAQSPPGTLVTTSAAPTSQPLLPDAGSLPATPGPPAAAAARSLPRDAGARSRPTIPPRDPAAAPPPANAAGSAPSANDDTVDPGSYL